MRHIRFLTVDELEAVLRAIPSHDPRGKLTWDQVCTIFATLDHTMILMAALTGSRYVRDRPASIGYGCPDANLLRPPPGRI